MGLSLANSLLLLTHFGAVALGGPAFDEGPCPQRAAVAARSLQTPDPYVRPGTSEEDDADDDSDDGGRVRPSLVSRTGAPIGRAVSRAARASRTPSLHLSALFVLFVHLTL